ncbi:MAG TPA: VOC family protein [Actinospica sp.]|nr:VOC family protein [Actinospica sp.]
MERVLRRHEASDAVEAIGWRFLLGTLRTAVPVDSVAQGAEAAGTAAAACGEDADRHLRIDVRNRRVVLTLQSLDRAAVTDLDAALAHRISAALRATGLGTSADVGSGAPHSVQLLELAIDALDIPAIRPFWRAVLGYGDEAGANGPADPLVDADFQGPAIWFQQMDRERPQRNRIHFDIAVPHDEAPRRVEAASAAGGRLLSDRRAPSFWVLCDPEGNEVCVTTWQGRDEDADAGETRYGP